jgi:modification methylase
LGSGTTAVSATKLDRKFVGYDISQEYINLAKRRLDPISRQTTLKFETLLEPEKK